MRVDAQDLGKRSSSVGLAGVFRVDPFKTGALAIHEGARSCSLIGFHVLAEFQLYIFGAGIRSYNAWCLR